MLDDRKNKRGKLVVAANVSENYPFEESVRLFSRLGYGWCQITLDAVMKAGKDIDITYTVQDGYNYHNDQKYSHIAIGAALKFFPDPKKMIDKCISLLEDGGIILASPFYIKTPIPEDLIRKFHRVFGMRPTTASYKDTIKEYKGLEILYEEHNDLLQETEEELAHGRWALMALQWMRTSYWGT